MDAFEKKLEIRWSDLDPNYHVRHAVYYDFGAFSRISFLNEQGITPALMLENNIGPILFREECVFKREIRFSDEVLINLKLDKAREDMSRWTMVHELWTKAHVLAAVITVDGAWIDTRLRKLTRPPVIFTKVLEQLPKTDKFEYSERK